MTIEEFIDSNRAELVAAVQTALTRYDKPGFHRILPKLDDDDLQSWVLNDESLYSLARSKGVRI